MLQLKKSAYIVHVSIYICNGSSSLIMIQKYPAGRYTKHSTLQKYLNKYCYNKAGRLDFPLSNNSEPVLLLVCRFILYTSQIQSIEAAPAPAPRETGRIPPPPVFSKITCLTRPNLSRKGCRISGTSSKAHC